MKKKYSLTALFSATLLIVFTYSSCKKNNDDDNTPTEQLNAEVKQHNSDESYYKGESDQADNDINDYVSNSSSLGGRFADGMRILSNPLCGVTVDSDIVNKTLTFKFDGVTPCSPNPSTPSRTRAGEIKVQLTNGNHWADVGAVLTLTYTNFKVTRLYDNKSITFNGVKTLKNINGNNWLGFFLGTTNLKYQERALNISVTFDSGVSATWNSARTTEWSWVAKGTNPQINFDYINFTARGDTSFSGYSNIDSWGVNRFGKSFVTNYNSPITSNTYCGLWRWNSGELVHHVNNANFTITLGVDQSGNPTPYACAYGFKISWINASGKQQTVILSY